MKKPRHWSRFFHIIILRGDFFDCDFQVQKAQIDTAVSHNKKSNYISIVFPFCNYVNI